MKYSDALKAIADSGLDNAAEIAEAIKNRVTASTQAESQLQQSQALLDSLFGALSVEGDSLSSKLDNAQLQIKSLREQKAAFENKYSEIQSELSHAKREGVINSAAQAIGAKPEVLRVLLNGVTEPLEIKDGKPILGGQDLKDWATTNHGAFLPSLFPPGPGPELPVGRLPSGTSAGLPPKEEKPNALTDYLKRYEKAVDKVLGGS
ncbi:MAG: hypothetical protein GPJ00_05380 [Microcystis aeruginosa W13-18]|nr:hypothetical protein [Microcystis aeruginosa W13-18]NCR35170.1 hypothetical protein [Microcystis aeruginosa S11-05]NCR48687.1 hypothetical protein [Microcystis aeruginosa S11-01]